MNRNDIQAEWAFYGSKLDVIGQLYLPPAEQPTLQPDLLFFCYYVCRIAVDRKITLSAVKEIFKQLRLGPALEKVVRWEEDRAYTSPARMVQYQGHRQSSLSAGMLFRDKIHFRFGHTGFGVFSNGRHFDFCAVGSVFVLLEEMYRRHKEEENVLAMLWQCAELIGKTEPGPALNKGNWSQAATGIYLQVTEDPCPLLTK